MGMASSQARLLTLTARMHQIEYKAARLEAQKLQMANESTRVYNEYLEALDAAKIQHKFINTDGSVTYKDVTFNDLYFGSTQNKYGIFSTQNDQMYIPQDIANTYETYKNSPDGFATAMTGYVPPVIPIIPNVGREVGGEYHPATGTNIEEGQDINLSRGQSVSTSIKDEITLTLNNPIGGSAYTYKIQSTNGSAVNANFEYLANGRIVVSGNNLKITAGNSQNDDIILLGKNNNVSTGDGNDIVRVGVVVDSNSFQGQSTGNTINTGSGKDHITVGSSNNTLVDSGSDTTVWYLTGNVANNTTKTNLSGSSAYYHGAGDFTNSTAGTLGVEGYASQGNSNDCRLYSLINSIAKNTNNGNLSNYVTITNNGDTYNVKFKNYNGSGINNINISKTEAKNYKGVSGDITTVLIDLAINKIMAQNKDDSDLQSSATNSSNAFSRAQYRTVSTYLFGNDNFAMYGAGINGDKNNALSKLNTIWNDYKNGNNNVTNVIVSFSSGNDRLGIVAGHAYSLKNLSANNYVELVNPWNDADVLRLDWTTFTNYFGTVSTFGSGAHNTPGIYCNVDSIAMMSEDGEAVTSVSLNATSAEQDSWDYYFNMHQAITAAGGYEIVPEAMRNNNTYLTDLINSGFVYLKEFDNKKDNWFDTSVSTNTSLQEVPDETLIKKAEAKYEADMKRIDLKDRRYDVDIAAIETERNAIKQEMETLKTVAKDNVERTFKLFS